MTTNASSPRQSFRHLSVEARTLLFIYASAAWARLNPNMPDAGVLLSHIENVWSNEQLGPDAASDPDHVTRLLEKHFEPLFSAAASSVAPSNKNCRMRVWK